MLVCWCHQILSGFQNKGHFSRLSRQSYLSVNIKGDNQMIPEVVNRYPGICSTAEKNTGKPHLEDRLMKVMRPFIASNGVPLLQMMPVQSHSNSEWEMEGTGKYSSY